MNTRHNLSLLLELITTLKERAHFLLNVFLKYHVYFYEGFMQSVISKYAQIVTN